MFSLWEKILVKSFYSINLIFAKFILSFYCEKKYKGKAFTFIIGVHSFASAKFSLGVCKNPPITQDPHAKFTKLWMVLDSETNPCLYKREWQNGKWSNWTVRTTSWNYLMERQCAGKVRIHRDKWETVVLKCSHIINWTTGAAGPKKPGTSQSWECLFGTCVPVIQNIAV